MITARNVDEQNQLSRLKEIKRLINNAQSDYANYHAGNEAFNRGYKTYFNFLLYRDTGISNSKIFNKQISEASLYCDALDLIRVFLTDQSTRFNTHSFATYVMDELVIFLDKAEQIYPGDDGCYSVQDKDEVVSILYFQAVVHLRIPPIEKLDIKIYEGEDKGLSLLNKWQDSYDISSFESAKFDYAKLNKISNLFPGKKYLDADSQSGMLISLKDVWPIIFSYLNIESMIFMFRSCKQMNNLAYDQDTSKQVQDLATRKFGIYKASKYLTENQKNYLNQVKMISSFLGASNNFYCSNLDKNIIRQINRFEVDLFNNEPGNKGFVMKGFNK